jgi:hypothetical protein
MLRRFSKGQSTAEYAIVIGLVIAAAVAMQVYVKRGIQGKIKDAVDFTKTDSTSGVTIGSSQYEPYYLSQNLSTSSNSASVATMGTSGVVNRNITGNEVTSRTGTVTTEGVSNGN